MTASQFANTVIVIAIGYLGFLLYVVTSLNISLFYRLPLIIIIVALVSSLKTPTRFRVRLVLVLLSAGFTVLLLETVLEITDISHERARTKAVGYWVQFDIRNPGEFARDLRVDGIHAYPPAHFSTLGPNSIELNGTDVFPLGGISQTATVLHCYESSSFGLYNSDDHGFNNPSGIWGRDDIDIVSVGDSMTHGLCASSNRNYTALIRSVHKNALNLGWQSTGPFSQFAVIKEYVGHLKPKVVLWFYFEGNDLQDLNSEPKNYPRLTRYLNDSNYSQNLMDKQSEIDRHLSRYVDQKMSEIPVRDIDQIKERTVKKARERSSLIRGSLYDIPRLANIWMISNSLPTFHSGNDLNDEASANLHRILTDSRAYIHSWGGELYFVYLPARSRYGKPAYVFSRRPETKSHDDIVSMAKSLGISVIDVKEAFDRHPDPLSLYITRWGPHYNEDGHRLVAKTVLEAIQLPR